MSIPRSGSRPPFKRRATDDPTPPVPARPAATVVLVRPAPDGLEVLLTRRPDTMAFAAGLHVFPGGRVDAVDADPRLLARARGRQDDPEFRVAHRIAAIRETWEEAGVLLAASRVGGSLPAVPPWDPAVDFAALCERLDLELRTDELVEVARWTTPRAYPRRFDTRFFVAELPPDATVELHPGEVVDHRWTTPRAALDAMARGEIELWPPTSTSLQRLKRAASFAQIRDGLASAPEQPIRVERLGDGLGLMTGQSAFGPGGRPANTVLIGRVEVVVVDPGDPGEAFLDAIEAEVAAGGGRIAAIALTHVDPGHASGSEELRARTGAPILTGPGGGRPLSWPVIEIGEGARLPGGDGAVRALATPGHRPDHLAFLLADGTLLTGDALTDRAPLVVPPEGEPGVARRTLERLRVLVAAGAVRRVIPGHGPLLDDPAGAIDGALDALDA